MTDSLFRKMKNHYQKTGSIPTHSELGHLLKDVQMGEITPAFNLFSNYLDDRRNGKRLPFNEFRRQQGENSKANSK